jgi:CHAT domain-containing protein
MSEQGRLASYRIVHFATHGLIAGELKGLAEPALVLTPPAEANDTDDGLLTASEVAQLKLNADWVVLSACNTAAAGPQGAEALSGLARAFFYAGARALLVSHWPVNSDAAVRLTTKAFAELRADPKIGRAEAMRRSMIDVITRGTDQENHPAYWAPFVVVGEGGG